MKFNKSSQLVLVSAASLLLAGLLTACGTLTVDFVYVTSARAAGPNSYGEVDVFEINSESGFMRQIPTSPFPSGGRNPVAEALGPDNNNLYVVNRDDNTIVQFIIGNDGKLYPQNTVNTPGIYPMAVTVAGSFLYVLDTYQPLTSCSDAAPCSGSIAVYPVTSSKNLDSSSGATLDGTLLPPVANGSQSYWSVCLHDANGKCTADVVRPTGVNVVTAASGTYVYVTARDLTTTTGYIFGFSSGSDGTLTPLNNGVPFPAGTNPSAITSVGGNQVFVADATNSTIASYSVGNGGYLVKLYETTPQQQPGNQPSAMVADPSGSYLYVASAQDSNVTLYTINNGTLTRVSQFATGAQPVAIGIDPGMRHFLFTANYLGNSVSGYMLNASDGTLIGSQDSPYKANAQPTAIVAIPHNGNQR